jgi:hypothetical protein
MRSTKDPDLGLPGLKHLCALASVFWFPAKRHVICGMKAIFPRGSRHNCKKLFQYARWLTNRIGWAFGGTIAGHLIGQFPGKSITGDKVTLLVNLEAHLPMRSVNRRGLKRHSILEINFVERESQISGRFEELLSVN